MESQAEIEQSLGESYASILSDGGVFMWLILLTSMILVATVIYKFLTLKTAQVLPSTLRKTIETFSSQPNDSNAEHLRSELTNNSTTLAQLCLTVLSQQEESKEHIEKSVEIKARDSIVGISSGLAILDVIITIAPLLGLLGTASGLVSVFSDLDVKESDHTVLAKGISEALYTTIAGLAVAVPAVIAQSYFTRKIETMATQLELVMSNFVTSISKY